jgi:hypothetical protein
MLHQRTSVSEHIKEINMKIKDLEGMISGVNVVESKLKQIIDNEQAYLHKQMQQYYNQVDIEESINLRRFGNQRF